MIGFLVVIVVWLGIIAFVFFKLSEPKEDVRLTWELREKENYKAFTLHIHNLGDEPFNITGVEAVYLPNDTIGWLWLEHHTVKPHSTKALSWLGWANPDLHPLVENSPERLALYNLLVEGKNEAILEVTVVTEKAIYTFHPQRYLLQAKPTTIEEK